MCFKCARPQTQARANHSFFALPPLVLSNFLQPVHNGTRLCRFFGGTGIALVRLVQQVRKSLAAKKEKVTGEAIAQFLQDSISWGHVSCCSKAVFLFHSKSLDLLLPNVLWKHGRERKNPHSYQPRRGEFLRVTRANKCCRLGKLWTKSLRQHK